MRDETKVAMKLTALQFAVDIRDKGDDFVSFSENAAALYQWIMEDIEEVPVETVTNLRPV